VIVTGAGAGAGAGVPWAQAAIGKAVIDKIKPTNTSFFFILTSLKCDATI
jgi:hypothetical protein